MKTFRRLEDFPAELRGGVLSVGKFDGLHRGHAEILARLTETARRRNAPSVVFTFDPPPALALRPDAPCPLLCDVERKIALFERFDLDALVLFPTTQAFLSRSATEFIAETVVGVFGATGLVEGEDFRFGRGQEADGAALSALCAQFGLTLEIAPSVLLDGDGEPISSSSIRAAVSRGDVSDAARALGRPFRLSGVVETGDRRGRTLGFPTANVAVPTSTVVPAPGLYAAKATLPDGRVFASAVNVGGNPTFGVSTFKIEAHLLDFCGDLYGQTLTLDFLRRLRDVVPFPTKDALLAQIAADVAETRRVCAATPEDAVR
ncbi:MAG: riboflavin biosynthesis protein RibF [Thermoguttaceae bacterium]|nr:riboflavin biosynthesis protein RibF [Thermoguttaceae bacterium]